MEVTYDPKQKIATFHSSSTSSKPGRVVMNQVLIAGSTVFLEFLPGLEAGYQACARAVEAGGITTIAGWNRSVCCRYDRWCIFIGPESNH